MIGRAVTAMDAARVRHWPPPIRSRTRRRLSNVEIFLALGVLATGGAFALVGREVAANVLMVWLILGCLWFSASSFETGLTVFVFAIPFDQIFYAWGDGRWNTLTYLLVAMLLVHALVGRRVNKRRSLNVVELSFLAWLAWGAITIYWSPADPQTAAMPLVTHLGGFLVFFAFRRHARSDGAVQQWLWAYVIAQLIMIGVQLLYYHPFEAFYWNEAQQRLQPSALGLGQGLSAVQLGRSSIVAAIAALALWEFERDRFAKLVAVPLTVVFGGAVLLAMSRAGMIALVAGVLAWTHIGRARMGRFKKTAVAATTVGLVGWGAMMVNSEAMLLRYDRTLAGYAEGDFRSMTNGRSYIWSVGLEMAESQPIMGVGYGGFPVIFSVETGDRPVAGHNEYLVALAETGAIGLLLMLSVVVSLGVLALRAGPWRHITVAWWAAFAIVIFFAGIGRAKDFWFVLGLIPYLVDRASLRRGPPGRSLPDSLRGSPRSPA